MPAYDNVLYEQSGPVVRLVLNRPQKLNALTDELMHELDDAVDHVSRDDTVRAVILTGAGRAFSAGYDLSPRPRPLQTMHDWREHATRAGCDVVMKIWDLGKPVVAAVRGHALGGGCDLVLAADLAIAADDAKFGEPEVRGVSAPPTLLMPWVLGMKRAKELLLTGDTIDATRAEQIGLVNRVVPAAELDAVAMETARKLAAIPPVSLRFNKMAINRAYETMGIRSAVAYGAEIFTLLMLSPEAAEFGKQVAEKGLKAVLAARDAPFTTP